MDKSYYLEKDQFIIEDYDKQKSFASFLPGVAGLDGIPMWTYYTNRGQGIAGFGVENKDGSILDFVPANQSYRRTEFEGFRTFIKKDNNVYEAFSSSIREGVQRKMIIGTNSVGFVEENSELGLTIEVKYFTATREKFPALIRKVTLKSLSDQPVKVELLDGLMTLWPYGTSNGSIKDMSNLATAWFETYNGTNNLPFYKNRSTTDDSAEVGVIEAGHFYGAFSSQVKGPLPVFYDPNVIFGTNTGNTQPWNFMDHSLQDLLKHEQVSANKIPCAFCGYEGEIIELTITSIIGKMNHIDLLNETAVKFNTSYFEEQEQKAYELGVSLSKDVDGKTAYPEFDAYVKQSFFDNLLRGGYPVVLEGKDGPIVYHVYSRIHGDMEREYNNFYVEPAYYSHGVGAFRDVNQNRRNDIYFVPEAGYFNIKQFMELIQLDGQNPLSIEGSQLKVNKEDIEGLLKFVDSEQDVILKVLEKEFTPGKLLTTVDDFQVELNIEPEAFLREVVKKATQEIKSSYGHGYWVDHWTYNMDLIDNYLNIYPDKFEQLMFEDQYRYFMSPALVLSRADKYVRTADNRIRQYDAVIVDDKRVKTRGIAVNGTNWETDVEGNLVTNNLYEKLVSLVVNKVASMDPSGIGIMMNTDKPGWNDAMNGLPGLFGSGTSETIEINRIVKLLISAGEFKKDIQLPKELAEFLLNYMKILKLYFEEGSSDLTLYEAAQVLKEDYNVKVAKGVSQDKIIITFKEISVILNLINLRLEQAIEKAIVLGDGIMPSYLIHEAIEASDISNKFHPINGMQNVSVSKWSLKTLPLYLEAPARYLKQVHDKKIAKPMYDKIKQSGMYDEKLGMYITSESLEKESLEIGRARAFVPGWLERESVFMHMEYKYLLGLIKSELYDEYFETIKKAFPPFMDPSVYGRSILENSSFIASSRNPDVANHGRGFVSRLTGTTSELITMWLYMMTGMKLFNIKGSELFFELKPVLPKDFFDENDEVSCTIFGDTSIVYNNPLRKNTFGADATQIIGHQMFYKSGKVHSCERISGAFAEDIRAGLVAKIDVQLG